MNTTNITVEQFINQQQDIRKKQAPTATMGNRVWVPVITVCMEPGSGGHLIASTLAERLNFRLFDANLLVTMANKAAVKSGTLNSIEKERPSGIQDFITAMVDNDYVYTGDYMTYLRQEVEIIGKLGQGVIVGRGANFILPPSTRFSVRVIAPRDVRIKNISFKYGVSLAEAKKRIKHREQRRRAFIREAFHQDISDIVHYDMILNTARMDLDTAVEAVIGAIVGAQVNNPFQKETTYILKGRK